MPLPMRRLADQARQNFHSNCVRVPWMKSHANTSDRSKSQSETSKEGNKLSDPGAVERNARMAQIALERARIRNGNNSPSTSAKKEGAVTSHDAQLNWGRAGQIETNTSRGDSSRIPEGAGVSGSEHLTATMPETLGRPVVPVANHDRSMNMADIIIGNVKTRDGGSR